MELYKLLHVFHLLIEWEFHSPENTRYHFGPDKLMGMKGPPDTRLKLLGPGFGNIVEQCGPPEPEIVCLQGDVIKYFKGMKEVVFMVLLIYLFHTFHLVKFGKDNFK